MSNTRLEEQLAGRPPRVQEEIIRINTDVRPLALQVALAIPLLAGLVCFLNACRMARLPDPKQVSSVEGVGFGSRAPERPG
jgi:hypothetical protein